MKLSDLPGHISSRGRALSLRRTIDFRGWLTIALSVASWLYRKWREIWWPYKAKTYKSLKVVYKTYREHEARPGTITRQEYYSRSDVLWGEFHDTRNGDRHLSYNLPWRESWWNHQMKIATASPAEVRRIAMFHYFCPVILMIWFDQALDDFPWFPI